MAEQALCCSATVVLADESLHRGVCSILCLSFTTCKRDFLSADPCSEMGADAWSLTNRETFFLFEPYKFPFVQHFNEWFLITTRNHEFIKLVLFLNSHAPAEELEREAGTTLKADTGICHWFLFQSFYLAIAAWGAQIIQVPNHHNTGQKSF